MLSIHPQRHDRDIEGNMQLIQDYNRSRDDAENVLSIDLQRHDQDDEGNIQLVQHHSRS